MCQNECFVFNPGDHKGKQRTQSADNESFKLRDLCEFLETTTIRYRYLLRDLLKLIAFRIGSDVSLNSILAIW